MIDRSSARRGSPGGPSRAAAHGSYRAGFAFGILSFLAIAAFGLLSAIATARIYGVRVIGGFALASAPVSALWVLSTVKEQSALIREVTGLPPRHPRVTELFAAVFTFSTALTAAMALLAGAICTLLLRGPLHHPELVWPMLAGLGGYAVVTNTGWNIDSIFSAFVAGRQLFWVRLHETLSFLAIAIALGLVWHSVWGLVLATIGGSLTALVHRVLAVRPFVRARLSRGGYRNGMRALPALLRFGLKITPGGIAHGMSQQAGVWAIASVSPTSVVGAYSRAQTIPDRFQQVNFRIVEVLYPTLVSRRARADAQGFDRALLDTIRYALAGMLLIAAACGGAARPLLSLFGAGFAAGAPAFRLLIAYPALSVIASAQTQALIALDRPGATSLISIARLALTVALTVVLTPRLGISGPAVALIAGFLLDIACKSAMLSPFLSSSLRHTWPARERVTLLAAYALGFAAALGVARSHGWLPADVLAGASAYAAALLLGGAVNGRDRARLGELLVETRSRRARRRRRRRLAVPT